MDFFLRLESFPTPYFNGLPWLYPHHFLLLLSFYLYALPCISLCLCDHLFYHDVFIIVTSSSSIIYSWFGSQPISWLSSILLKGGFPYFFRCFWSLGHHFVASLLRQWSRCVYTWGCICFPRVASSISLEGILKSHLIYFLARMITPYIWHCTHS